MPRSEESKARRNAQTKAWREKNPEKSREIHRRWRVKVRLNVLQHYSGSEVPFCACCGESELVFLALDHINGDGAARRRETKSGGGAYYYSKVRAAGFPDGYRVLCCNCNHAYGVQGFCPHTT